MAKTGRHSEDFTGHRRLVWNVLTGWIAHVVTIIAGFVIPRLIDENLGQTELGIWDFGWATVRYLQFSNLGAAAALNRYVALHRAAGEPDALSRMVSSVVACQIVIAAALVLVIGGVVALIPWLVHETDAQRISLIQMVVVLLTAGVVAQVLSSPARGVITGCHRWDLHNAVTGTNDILLVLGLGSVLLFGGGLVMLAAVHFCVVLFTESVRWRQAFVVCPEMRVKMAYAEWASARTTLAFGTKSAFLALPRLVVVQTTNILLAGAAGTASLALLARPMALVTHIETLIKRLAFIVAPMTGGMIGLGQQQNVGELFVQSGRGATMIAAPVLAVLALYGGYILMFWMGPAYAAHDLSMYLSIGMLLPVTQNVAIGVLTGVNAHGRIGIVSLLVVAVVFVATVIAVPADAWTPERAALVMGAVLSIGPGMVVPILTARVLGVGVWHYIYTAVVVPLLCTGAFVAVVLLLRTFVVLPNQLATELFALGVGSSMLLALYWRVLLPDSLKRRIVKTVFRRGQTA